MITLFKRPLIAITLFSALLSLFHWYWSPLLFNADSEQYLRTAFALNGKPGEFYYFRTWGYPIFLSLFGVTKFHTFYIILAVQTLLGILIPVVIYETIRPFHQRLAVILALLSAVTFAPYLWQKLIMTDQISMFLYYFLTYGVSRFIIKQSNKNLALIWVAGLMLFLMRPSAMLIYMLSMACLLVFYFHSWRKILVGVLLFIGVTAIFQISQRHIIDTYTQKYALNKTFTKGSMMGRMFFFNIYAVGPLFTHALTVERGNGECSEQLYNDLVAWRHDGLKHWRLAFPSDPLSNFNMSTVSSYINSLFKTPTLFNHSIMWLGLDQRIGPKKADKLFACAAFEGLSKHPTAVWLFFKGFIQYFMAGDIVYNQGKITTWDAEGISSALVSYYFSSDPGFPQKLLAEQINEQSLYKDNISISKAIYKVIFYWQSIIKIIAALIAVILFPVILFCRSRQLSCIATMLFLYLVYQAMVSVTFAAPHFRYSSPQIPMIIMLAGLGALAICQLLTRCKTI